METVTLHNLMCRVIKHTSKAERMRDLRKLPEVSVQWKTVRGPTELHVNRAPEATMQWKLCCDTVTATTLNVYKKPYP